MQEWQDSGGYDSSSAAVSSSVGDVFTGDSVEVDLSTTIEMNFHFLLELVEEGIMRSHISKSPSSVHQGSGSILTNISR